jgi:DeoR family glycerol-3-phosphate regulon repressor
VRIGHLSQVDVFVTDRAPPDSIVELCEHSGVELEISDAGQSYDSTIQAAE